jgi:hypothetical protein
LLGRSKRRTQTEDKGHGHGESRAQAAMRAEVRVAGSFGLS